MLQAPPKEKKGIKLVKGPNIKPLPSFDPLPKSFEGPVCIKIGNDLSTDEILPGGARVLPYRSNIQKISEFTFEQVDSTYFDRVKQYQKKGHFVVGGLNYGQGSSREHAAMAPRYLGVKAILAKSFARIHLQNLINFGVLPLTFVDRNDYAKIEQGDVLEISNLPEAIRKGKEIKVFNKTKKQTYLTTHSMSARQVNIMLEGGEVNLFKQKINRKS